jgi:hypothetical protein
MQWASFGRGITMQKWAEPASFAFCLEGMIATPLMDAHTLELLEFHKVREQIAGYGYCSLGKDLALQAEPSTDLEAIRAEIALVSEMVDVLGQGQ